MFLIERCPLRKVHCISGNTLVGCAAADVQNRKIPIGQGN
jgi:hypothetical protein